MTPGWEQSHAWPARRYGGGPAIMRECYAEGSAAADSRKVVAAVYYLRLTVCHMDRPETARITVSKQARAVAGHP